MKKITKVETKFYQPQDTCCFVVMETAELHEETRDRRISWIWLLVYLIWMTISRITWFADQIRSDYGFSSRIILSISHLDGKTIRFSSPLHSTRESRSGSFDVRAQKGPISLFTMSHVTCSFSCDFSLSISRSIRDLQETYVSIEESNRKAVKIYRLFLLPKRKLIGLCHFRIPSFTISSSLVTSFCFFCTRSRRKWVCINKKKNRCVKVNYSFLFSPKPLWIPCFKGIGKSTERWCI